VLRTRILTAAVALPALLAAIFLLPDWAFTLMIGILGLWGLYEVYEAMRPLSAISVCSMLGFGLFPLLWLFDPIYLRLELTGVLNGIHPRPSAIDVRNALVVLLIVVAFALFNIAKVAVSGPKAIPRDLAVLAGAGYVGPLFPFFALVRNGPNGIELLVLMLLLVICADTGAYFVGRAIGRHKLAFKVSPGKTIEGAIGGIIAAIAGGLILRPWLAPQWDIERLIVFAGLVAILAIIGDLANSAFKRVAGVKDSGWIFPGHGGLLDRTCSLVLAAVLTYYYSR
jgi:phosphatidate cytidylyltransferase